VIKKIIIAPSLLMCLGINVAVSWAPFKVSSINYEGLNSLRPELFDTAVNIKAGDILTEQKSNELIQRLFSSGYFDDIKLKRKGNTLIIDLAEQPTVAKVDFKGNSLIKTKDLTKVMESAGLVSGESFNPSLVKQIKQSLVQQYYTLGKYAVKVTIKQKKLSRNRVAITIDISEGVYSKIKSINILGNHAFSEHKLIKKLPISTPGLFTFFTSSDRFDQANLQKALLELQSFYMNRGYADFQVLSTENAISPDHKSFYLTFNISEGKKYYFGNYEIFGDTIFPKKDIESLIKIKPGKLFSRKEVLDSVKAIKKKISDSGYAFVNVQPVPEINKKTGILKIKFYIDAGRKVIVRRVNFLGNTYTNEIVFRRDLQFVEGSVYNGSSVNKSTNKLKRHPYVSEAKDTLVPVKGSSNQVDVNYDIKERSANGIKLSIGYSDLDKFFIGSSLDMPNLFGTGNSFSISTQLSRPQQSLNFSFTQPYFTLGGISQTVSAYLSRTDNARRQNYIGYSMDTYGFSLNYGFPINDTDTFNFGGGYDFKKLFPPGSDYKSQTFNDFEKENNNRSTFNSYLLNLGWSHNSLNRSYFPTQGTTSSLSGKIAVPGSSLTWYTTSLSGSWYYPITDYFTLNVSGNANYGNGYGKTNKLPFFLNYYAGGWGSVRGYQDSDLGPHDLLCKSSLCSPAANIMEGNAIGGNLLLDGSVDVIFPVPFVDSDSMRFSVFLDAGNVYDTYSVKSWENHNGNPTPTHPTFNNLRYSAGVAFNWLSPIGSIGFSLAKPISQHPGDNAQMFAFNMGQSF
jgi:outer membrane protein insertion porin family